MKRIVIVMSLLLLTACDKYKVGDCIVSGPLTAKVTGVTDTQYEVELFLFGMDAGPATGLKEKIDKDERSRKVNCKELGL